MKVLLVSSKYPPEYAGSGLRAHETYKRLHEKFGVQFEVICNTDEFRGNESYTYEGVSVSRIDRSLLAPNNLGRLPWPLNRVGPSLAENLEALATIRLLESKDFDVVHTFGNAASTSAALWWTRRRDVPVMMEICNNVKTPYQDLPIFGHLNATPLGFISEYNLKRQAVVVAISSHLGKLCAEYGLESNVWTRPNPVDKERFHPDRMRANSVESITPFSQDHVIVIYVALFKDRKNHDFLVEVLDELPEEYKLVLAGPIDEGGSNESAHRRCVQDVRERITEYEIDSRVYLNPTFVDMAEYLSVADVFCFPAENEAMGTPILESLCSGVPVVANADEPSFREWIREGENGHLRELEPTAWAEAIRAAYSIPEDQRRAFAERLIKTVSADILDRQYYRLLSTLKAAHPDEVLSVDECLEGGGYECRAN